MDKGYLDNHYYKDKLNNLTFDFQKHNCKFYLKKNGKMLYFPHEIYKYICIFNKTFFYKQCYDTFRSLNNNFIIKNFLIFAYIQKNSNLNYIFFSDHKERIVLFDKNLIESFDIFLNILYIVQENLNSKKKKNSLLEILSIEFLYLRFSYCKKISDKDILIQLFYQIYIKDKKLKEEIKNKYNKDITLYFANYHDLYLFLKKEGYVKKFYNEYYQYIKDNSEKIYNNYILNNKEKLGIFKLKIEKKIQNFNDINLIDLIDNYVVKDKDKNYIKNKFIELRKKYNI